ncbi:MAG: cohesin domain-containing protein [Acidobacteria bacterium]|nr:cohesin domain-containing protein [Acidobacteriota bacterium]
MSQQKWMSFWTTSRFVVLLVVLLGVGFLTPPANAAEGDNEYKAGKQAEVREDYDEAFRQYKKAFDLDPQNPQFIIAFRRAQFLAGANHVDRGNRLQEQGRLSEALAEFEQAYAIDPASAAARQQIASTLALLEAQQAPPAADREGAIGVDPRLEEALGPPELQPLSQDLINLRMTNDSKVVFETIGRLAGINVLFDPDYVSPPNPITVELMNIVLEEALDQTALLTKTFWKVLTRNTILVVPDTTVKRREQEQQVIKTFYLSNTITPQELTEVVTAIRTLLETRRIQQINSMNAIIIRDTPDKVALAEKIIQDVDKAKPEVVVDVLVLEVRRDKTRDLGLFPVSGGSAGVQVPLIFSPGQAAGGDGGSIALNRLGNLASSDFSLILPGANLNALLSDSNTKILQRPQIRATDGMQATLRIGDRIPIATGSFQAGIGGVGVNPLVSTQFQYTDVGVNLDITPKVHANREITLKVRIEISAVTQRINIGGIEQPVIGQRVIEHDIRLREGEANVLGGILQRQVTESVSGIPGLSRIPILRYLFSNTSTTLAEDEVLIVLRPRLVRLPEITALNRRALDVGREGNIRLRNRRSTPEVDEEAAEEPSGSASVAPARIRFQPVSLEERVEETFQVNLEIENARDLFSIPMEVSYDTGYLKLSKVRNGSFLGRDGQLIAVVQRVEEQSGKATITLTRPPDSGGVSGSGRLVSLTFEALRPGTTSLLIIPVGVRSPTREFLPVAAAQATVTIH